jgi:serine/threonine protein kinase
MVGPWALGERLGRGGQGSVYLATRGEGPEFAAAKVLNLSRPKKRARFLREVEIHASLSAKKAPNIIPIIDHNLLELSEPENGVEGYIVMPRAKWSLEDLTDLYQGRVELCLETFVGVANGIAIAHREGVIHRDIKPANVLFLDSSCREPMVSDFGICLLKETAEADRITDVGESVGARWFMAPEQEAGGISDIQFAADVYALGKLLHYMLTARHLPRERLSEAFTEQELRDDERLNLIQDQILARAIVEDPSARLQTSGELLTIVREILRSFRRAPRS